MSRQLELRESGIWECVEEIPDGKRWVSRLSREALEAVLVAQPSSEGAASAPDGIDGKRWEHIANEVIDGGAFRRNMIPESRRELKERIVDALVRAAQTREVRPSNSDIALAHSAFKHQPLSPVKVVEAERDAALEDLAQAKLVLEGLWELSEEATQGDWILEFLDGYITGHIVSPMHNYCGNRVGRKDSITAPDSMTRADGKFIVACVNYVRAALSRESQEKLQ